MTEWKDVPAEKLDKYFDEAVRMRDQWQERIEIIQAEKHRRLNEEVKRLKSEVGR